MNPLYKLDSFGNFIQLNNKESNLYKVGHEKIIINNKELVKDQVIEFINKNLNKIKRGHIISPDVLNNMGIKTLKKEDLSNSPGEIQRLFDFIMADPSLISKLADVPEHPPFKYMPKGNGIHGTPEEELETAKDFAIKFCEARKNGDIDIYSHIDYLCEPLKRNFNAMFPPEIVLTYDQERRELVEAFRAEINQRISDKMLTYEYWVPINMRMCILATDPQSRSAYSGDMVDHIMVNILENDSWKTHEEIIKMLDAKVRVKKTFIAFDSTINHQEFFIYATSLANVPIGSMNGGLPKPISVAGLTPRPIPADGRIMQPDAFFRHDLGHFDLHVLTLEKDNVTWEDLNKVDKKFQMMLEYFNNEPEMNQLLNVIYFIIWHENREVKLLTQYVDKIADPSKPLREHLNFTSEENYHKVMRNDWYKESLPNPKDLNFQSYHDMFEYGLDVLQIFLESDNFDDVSVRVQALNSNQNKQSIPDPEEMVFAVPRNPAKPDGEEIKLNKADIDLYNQILSEYSATHDNQRALQMAESNPKVSQILQWLGLHS